MTSSRPNRYEQLIGEIFNRHYSPGAREVIFDRDDLVRVATELGVRLPKNLGDLVYAFRYRAALPERIRDLAGKDSGRCAAVCRHALA